MRYETSFSLCRVRTQREDGQLQASKSALNQNLTKLTVGCSIRGGGYKAVLRTAGKGIIPLDSGGKVLHGDTMPSLSVAGLF